MQKSLFKTTEAEIIALPDGEIHYYPHWMVEEEALSNFAVLHRELAWEQSTIRIQGRTIPIPRLNAWYGDPGVLYSYSGITLSPLPWTDTLVSIKTKIENTTPFSFNSVLANLYRNGQDGVAWHSDDERELGENPVIASASFGAERRFTLKHRYKKDVEKIELRLENGSLLLMAGKTQHYWLHQLPKTAKPTAPRINLTFRKIVLT